jgi:hypothetical protein
MAIEKYKQQRKKLDMTLIDDFVSQLFHGKNSKESYSDFVKYYNDKFEVLVFDNRVLVKDKRATTMAVYNNLNIAKARLLVHSAA